MLLLRLMHEDHCQPVGRSASATTSTSASSQRRLHRWAAAGQCWITICAHEAICKLLQPPVLLWPINRICRSHIACPPTTSATCAITMFWLQQCDDVIMSAFQLSWNDIITHWTQLAQRRNWRNDRVNINLQETATISISSLSLTLLRCQSVVLKNAVAEQRLWTITCCSALADVHEISVMSWHNRHHYYIRTSTNQSSCKIPTPPAMLSTIFKGMHSIIQSLLKTDSVIQ